MKEKTKLSKILALAICLMLILMMFSSYSYANITASTNTAKIIVNGVEAGVKVSAYQLTTVNYDYDNDVPTSTPYAWTNDIKPLVTAINSNYTNDATGIETFVKEIEEGGADASEAFYDKLASAIKTGNITAKYSDTSEGELAYPVETNSKVEFDGCEMGTYLIIIENGYKVYTPSVINLTPEYNTDNNEWELKDQTVTIKATNPTIEKSIVNEKDGYSTKDTITYQIVGNVPKYLEESVAKKYYISDKLSDNLTLDTLSIKVYGQNGSSARVQLTATTDYTLTTSSAVRPSNSQPVSFLINFVYDNIKGYEKVIVEYNARITLDESVFEDGNIEIKNDAYLDYNNNPYEDVWQTNGYDDGEVEDTESTVKIYTYGAIITNTDKEGTVIQNGGAEFTLTLGDETQYFKKSSDGVYFVANSTDEGDPTQTLVVGANGTLKIYGLETGTYTLTQTKAPNGYNKASSTTQIPVVDSEPDGVIDDDDDAIIEISFINGTGFQLPITGGIGTVVFVAGGILLIEFGLVILAVVIKLRRYK